MAPSSCWGLLDGLGRDFASYLASTIEFQQPPRGSPGPQKTDPSDGCPSFQLCALELHSFLVNPGDPHFPEALARACTVEVLTEQPSSTWEPGRACALTSLDSPPRALAC